MGAGSEIKQQVRQFYDQVGWQQVGEQLYQNAHYEDLRPVSRGYIHRCHLRLGRFLKPAGQMLLDAGSGPIQYPEYLAYSQGYRYRVCADISITALKEARKRIGEAAAGGKGLFVVCDIAALPFKPGIFEGVVSLHTIHHLPEEQHAQAYGELYRVLSPGCSAAVVNGWPSSPLMRRFDPLIRLANRLQGGLSRLRRGSSPAQQGETPPAGEAKPAKGTFTSRHGVTWVKGELGRQMPVEIRVWRSVSVRFLRALIHPWLGGRLWLALIYFLEERFPHYLGEHGQYPLIIIRKP